MPVGVAGAASAEGGTPDKSDDHPPWEKSYHYSSDHDSYRSREKA
ncbi:hypothetical protein AB0I37_16065 [Micromonospora purpureochromogenes]